MARLLGVDVPDNKRIIISLTYVHGIGRTSAKQILDDLKIDENIRTKDLKDTDLANIRSKVEEMKIPIEGELRRIVRQNIRRLQDIRSYRGERHAKGLPARGQRTSSNARTRKGKRKTVAGAQKKSAAKK
jgi:small subunit ribosomal protein S13